MTLSTERGGKRHPRVARVAADPCDGEPRTRSCLRPGRTIASRALRTPCWAARPGAHALADGKTGRSAASAHGSYAQPIVCSLEHALTYQPPPFVPMEYHDAAMRWISETVRALERELHPILNSFRSETIEDLPVDEGGEDALEQLPEVASPLFRPMKYEHGLTVSVDEVLAFDVDSFLAAVHAMADDMGQQMVKGMLEHLSEICDANGQVINAPDGDLYEALLEALETVDFEFNEDGTHNLQVMLHPDTAQKLIDLPPTPDQERRAEEILQRRREEWRASRRRRQLP